VVILIRPFLDQNVGATARNMLNFGLAHLRLVAPQCNHLSDDAMARAAGARDVLTNAQVFPTMEEAVQDCHQVHKH
jgi:tRNA/rRNA methyltransferase